MVSGEILRKCLAPIAAGDKLSKEVVVVDQSSNLEISKLLEEICPLGVATRHSPSLAKGRAAGSNLEIGHVTTPYVAINDDDCFVAEDWLQKMR